jgi:hypothetical protein
MIAGVDKMNKAPVVTKAGHKDNVIGAVYIAVCFV